jgi:hypothetical protein
MFAVCIGYVPSTVLAPECGILLICNPEMRCHDTGAEGVFSRFSLQVAISASPVAVPARGSIVLVETQARRAFSRRSDRKQKTDVALAREAARSGVFER